MISRLAFIVAICSPLAYAQSATHIYQQELKAFEQMPEYKNIFDEDVHKGMGSINCDIKNYAHLTFFQRLLRRGPLFFDVIIVTPKTMPTLYAYIEQICTDNYMAMPTVFLAPGEGFANAAALKLLTSSGAIVIGKKLLLESSDAALRGIVSHELGHIKHNHSNKTLALHCTTAIAAFALSTRLFEYGLARKWFTLGCMRTIPALIINKSFERKADEFAYENAGAGEGLLEAFEGQQRKEERYENDFIDTHKALEDNRSQLETIAYLELKIRYHLIKAKRWLYYDTPLGAHPSMAERIKTIKNYLATAQ